VSERNSNRNPLVVMAIGGFIGGLIAGSNKLGFFALAALCLTIAYGLLFLLGHIDKARKSEALGIVLGLSTFVTLPCGVIGMIASKHI